MIDNQNISMERGLLSNYVIKESQALGLREPVVAPVSKERFAYFVVIKYSKFSFFLSQIISLNASTPWYLSFKLFLRTTIVSIFGNYFASTHVLLKACLDEIRTISALDMFHLRFD